MKRYKICVYAICKNEAQFVDRWMDSMGEADAIIVTDTGSTDGTVEKLRARGATVYEEIVKPWRFDVARNLSLDHVPDNADICVCTDLDEVFRPGWRKKLEAAWRPRTTMANYIYNWSHKSDGSPGVQFTYFKVHTKKDYRWAYPVHEVPTFVGVGKERKVFVEGMILDHYPDDTKSRGNYLPLLQMATAEAPQDDRMAYYLGREYFYTERWKDCIQECTRHLALPSANWSEERSASMRLIAKAHCELENYAEAGRWFLRAIAECPRMRDAYIECARAAYEQEDWVTVFAMAESALKIPKRSTTYTNAEYAWDHTPHDFASLGCYYLGMRERARRHAEAAVALAPGDERLRRNLEMMQP
jgi:glycosyltransferase involved in cell wall biosynthesis